MSEPPHYTTSLDAAMELMPEGGYLSLWERKDHALTQSEWWAEIDLPNGKTTHGESNTPATALTIACLKARIEHDKIGETK
jgi:hypothetical protein